MRVARQGWAEATPETHFSLPSRPTCPCSCCSYIKYLAYHLLHVPYLVLACYKNEKTIVTHIQSYLWCKANRFGSPSGVFALCPGPFEGLTSHCEIFTATSQWSPILLTSSDQGAKKKKVGPWTWAPQQKSYEWSPCQQCCVVAIASVFRAWPHVFSFMAGVAEPARNRGKMTCSSSFQPPIVLHLQFLCVN